MKWLYIIIGVLVFLVITKFINHMQVVVTSDVEVIRSGAQP